MFWRVRLLMLPAMLIVLMPRCARCQAEESPVVRIGAKAFAESQILGEMLRLLAREAGAETEDLQGLADTPKVWNALLVGQIDAYCEYTGTLTQQILAGKDVDTTEKLRQALAQHGLRMSHSLGFADSYELGMTRKRASELSIRAISDLRKHAHLKVGFSAHFLDRPDGWRSLRSFYGLPQDTRDGMEHALALRALGAGTLDVTDVNTTDAAIRRDDLVLLDDDRHFFPSYDAIILYREDLEDRAPRVVEVWRRLEGKISAADMIDLNGRVEIEKQSERRAAAAFLRRTMSLSIEVADESLWERVLVRTRQHLLLVAVSLVLAIVVAVPLGIAAARRPRLGYFLLAAVGIVQTIPALALLVLLLVLLRRIGPLPAIAALFLYSLLPIVRNTYTGLHDIALPLRESAEALGLGSWPRLYLIELPLASRAILAGIKTAAVINVGYATLGGLIGAGGYGEPIMNGVTRSDPHLILEGAVPAVVMALLVQALFEVIERIVVPKGLRLRMST
ncbi:MAG TPA: glycine betaine ABC transporter substrate-binding protein [Gemmataceae bacterium]|nr:glycine betaine ABC transporter substrate-binding protein [Gemmataceae bacterium]